MRGVKASLNDVSKLNRSRSCHGQGDVKPAQCGVCTVESGLLEINYKDSLGWAR